MVSAYWKTVLSRAVKVVLDALGWDTTLKIVVRGGIMFIAAGVAIWFGFALGQAVITGVVTGGVALLVLAWAIIVVPARMHAEATPAPVEHAIALRCDPDDDKYVHPLDEKLFVHGSAFNRTSRAIEKCSVVLEVPTFSRDNTTFTRVDHIRAQLPLQWCLADGHPDKYRETQLVGGDNLFDILVAAPGEVYQGRPFFRAQADPNNGVFRIFWKIGFYRLRVVVSCPDATAEPLDLLVHWTGDWRSIRVTRLSAAQ